MGYLFNEYYSTENGGQVDLNENPDGVGLIDGEGNYYGRNVDGTVAIINDPPLENVHPDAYLIGGGAAIRATALLGKLLGPTGSVIGHPAYGGRTINSLRSGKHRFGWGRDNGPTLRFGRGNKHYDVVRLKPPKQ